MASPKPVLSTVAVNPATLSADRPCVQVEPELLDTQDATKLFGGIVENTFKPLMHEHGVKPVRVGRRVLWYLRDLRRVVAVLVHRSSSEQEPA